MFNWYGYSCSLFQADLGRRIGGAGEQRYRIGTRHPSLLLLLARSWGSLLSADYNKNSIWRLIIRIDRGEEAHRMGVVVVSGDYQIKWDTRHSCCCSFSGWMDFDYCCATDDYTSCFQWLFSSPPPPPDKHSPRRVEFAVYLVVRWRRFVNIKYVALPSLAVLFSLKLVPLCDTITSGIKEMMDVQQL